MSQPGTPAIHPLDAALTGVSEFPDRLGPVLIKELRQGLRSGLFVLPFVVLPAVLAIVAVWALAIDNIMSARQGVAFFFWCAVCIPVLVLTPLRGLGAIRSEREAQTLDLLQLTPLSAWRIVVAKWSSLVVQSCLWVIALLPFLVLRYFFGAMNLTDESVALLFIVTGGALLTAIALSVSTFPRLLFWIALGGLLFFAVTLLVGLASPGTRGAARLIVGLAPSTSLLAFAAQVVLALHLTYLALTFAAARIAPRADNYALRLRTGVLALFGWYALAAAFFEGDARTARWAFLGTAAFAVVLLACFELVAQPVPLLAHVRPWVRFGPPGMLLARAFLPGWPSALLFLSGATLLTLTIIRFDGNGSEAIVPALLLWIAAVLPRTIQSLFFRGGGERPGLHLILHITGGLVAAVLGPFSFAMRDAIVAPAAVFPSALWWLTLTEVIRERLFPVVVIIAGAWILAMLVLATFASTDYWKEISRCVRTVRLAPTRDNAPPP